jgi:hypothetical protein
MSETWILYKADSRSAEGWRERKLMPSGGLTNLLTECWDYSGSHIPQVGDRIRDYANLADPGNGVTHGKDGDWVVTKIQQFSSFDTADRIVVCYCSYQPIEADWQPLKRGLPVDEMLELATA